MKEFAEKLIKRLEENSFDMSLENPDCKAVWTDKAISIVNELAGEYENDFCEWSKQDDCNLYLHKTSCGTEDTLDDSYKFCPYCGRKMNKPNNREDVE